MNEEAKRDNWKPGAHMGDVEDGLTISSSRKGSRCVLIFVSLLLLNSIKNWIAIQNFLPGLRDIDTVQQQRNSIVYFSDQSRVLSDFLLTSPDSCLFSPPEITV